MLFFVKVNATRSHLTDAPTFAIANGQKKAIIRRTRLEKNESWVILNYT